MQVQEYRATRVTEYRGTMGTAVQGYNGYSGTGVQGYRVDVLGEGYKGSKTAGVEQCKGRMAAEARPGGAITIKAIPL